ncbi:hypothetical protein Vretimale_1325 [Volvox reticuliferus]|uniref:Peptidase M20 dimerisation domain-containing protein n=1 Tax=Volvox reticuliferus TaxID=1737510 RepID=A0A8J4CH54_9CHLO|nr:hypothetical protein Vretifemale_10752 [Volvox reticuliferus]GIL95296.1 hypothetical protein Vretimale_1325 [Volvox reticuliferus]
MLSRGFCRTFGVRSLCARPIASAVKCKARDILLYASASSASPVLAKRDEMANDDAIAGLKPELLWRYFKDLTQIPRPSKHEQRVLQYLKDFATERQLAWQQDAVGNLVIRRPGSGGGEGAPCVVVQGHVDMVCEKEPFLDHNFLTDPLVLRRDGDWLKATGTTLGADNGIGVAAALALLSSPPSAKLPPLECLFTVDEETGLTGAFDIAPDLVTGRTMLNLDTEDWGEVFIGCSGGGDMSLMVEVALESLPSASSSTPTMTAHVLKLGGLLGGHSGLNIHEGRGNAVQLMARALAAVAAAAGPDGWRLVDLAGGDKRNAIARDASAVLLIAEDKQATVAAAVESLLKELRTEYGTIETGLSLTLTPAGGGDSSAAAPTTAVAPGDAERLLSLLRGLPHGPLKFSHAVPGLVETSNNVASIKEVPSSRPTRRRHVIVTSTRSSLMGALEATRDVIQGLARLAGCVEVLRGKAYPGWQPDLESKVLQVTLDAYRDMLGGNQTAKVGAIHAGLECGILGEKFPGVDMVSFGPTIKGAHSPDERVKISTVEPFWELTIKVLERLADVRH